MPPLHLLHLIFLTFLFTLPLTGALKFLSFNPITFHSPANFQGRITETLVEAGHEVVMLSPILHLGYPNTTSKLARIIHIPGNPLMLQFEEIETVSAALGLWTSPQANPFRIIDMVRAFMPSWVEGCRVTLDTPGLLDQLREERFDAAFGETISPCGFGIFHLLGIDKFAVTSSFASLDGHEHITGVPAFTSFQPALMSLHGYRMSFFGRVSNLLFHYGWSLSLKVMREVHDDFFHRRYPEMPKLEEIMKNSSFFFLNTDPLIDFLQIASAKMINIGGIALPRESSRPLEEPLASLMSARPHTVLISFGSVMYSCLMPPPFKETILALARSMPNVTFIWKYEKPEDKIAAGIPNLFTAKWLPQADILRDSRLSAFVTHGGAGSAYEAVLCGIPTVTVPVMSDQMRNSEMLRRLRTGRIVQGDELATPQSLIDAVRDVLQDERYLRSARRIASMVAEQPVSVQERLVRHYEFMARFGPLDQLNHAGRDMGIVTFYNLEIFGAAISALALPAYVIVKVLFFAVRFAVSKDLKQKSE